MATAAEQRISLLSDLIQPKPKQRAFLDGMFTHKYVLFGGAAGPGKSYMLRWALIWFLWRCYKDLGLKGVRVGLFCETYTDLKDRQISKVRAEFPSWLGKYHAGDHEFRLSDALGSGVIAFRNLDNPEKYRSVEFAAEAVDELTQDSREDFEDLRTRLRWPGIEHSPFIAASNPTGPGHAWVKKLWIDRDFTGDLDGALEPDQFLFVPALPKDNDSLPRSYYEMLMSLEPRRRKALLEGDWSVFSGQAFEEFRRRDMQERPYHVIPVRGIPAHWKRVAGHDWGYGALCYTCWAAIDPDGGLIIYKELAGRQWSPSTIAGNIITVQGSDQVPVIWAGVDIWQEHRSRLSADQLAALKEKGLGQLSVADQYVRAGLKTMRPCPNLDRHSRKQRIHELLGPRADGRPYLRIMENCPVLIKTLEQIQLAKHDPEDVETTYAPTAEVRDDPYDGLGHMVMALPKLVLPAAPPPQTVKPYRPHIVEAPVGYQPAGAPLQVRWGGR